jgi:hypothetical protein
MRLARNIAGMGVLGTVSLLAACGDPVPPAAQASVSIHIREYDRMDPVYGMTSCPPSRHWINVPYQRERDYTRQAQHTTDSEAPERAVHNQNGDSITCSVKESGSGFKVTARAAGYSEFDGKKLTNSIVHIGIGQIGSSGTASGTLTVMDHASLTQYLSEDCTYTVQGGALGVEPGKIWGSVSCQGLGDASSPGTACEVDTGFFVFENCAR